MEWVTDKVCWFPEHRMLINWGLGFEIKSLRLNRYLWDANLVLTCAPDNPACLIVQKDRYGTLRAHENTLNLIFEEYELDCDHYRGRVLLSDTEYTRWRLMRP